MHIRFLTLTAALASLAACVTVIAPATDYVADEDAAFEEMAIDDGVNDDRIARVGEHMQRYVDQGKLAGATLLVLRSGEPVLSTSVGFRDKEAGVAMTDDTIFRIASQTKAIVSTAILMLQEDGELLINDPVGKYLPEWSKTTVAVPDEKKGYKVVSAERQITIRDLLTHTAGVDYGLGNPAESAWREAGITGWYFADRAEPVANVVARMAALPQAAQPGDRFVYGYSTDILGALIEKVSGKTLDVFLQERIFSPLEMNDTQFFVDEADAGRLAVVYSVRDGVLRRAGPDGMQGQGAYVQGPRKAFSGGAGLTSTAADYARFLEMLRNYGTTSDGVRILGRKSVELMTTDHLKDGQIGAGLGFGLGFRITKDIGQAGQIGSYGAFSWGGAYHSTYWVDPSEGLTVVYLTQLNPAGDIDDHGKLRALIYQALD